MKEDKLADICPCLVSEQTNGIIKYLKLGTISIQHLLSSCQPKHTKLFEHILKEGPTVHKCYTYIQKDRNVTSQSGTESRDSKETGNA